ncbi:MAG TPA: C40 family peptidase [Gemmatimonadaceae bacterium]|jgi:cell wall-associated NlpC family hydrolase|nr:C40 family peptidase [Gemmatimonadaceae bacterium]
MFPPARSYPLGAIAVASLIPLSACTPASLGITPESVLGAIISTLPAEIPTSDGRSSPSPSPSPSSRGKRRIPDSPPPSAEAARVLRTASDYVGTRYTWGGNTPGEGFDCSGFTKYVFAKYHITLPRTSREQAHAGRAIPADFSALRPGDLMMFAEPGGAISHVAIYVGDGRIIHSSTSGHGVAYTDLNAGGDWFYSYFVVARRVL